MKKDERGFTMIESLVALTILLVVMGAVMGNMIQFSKTQSTVWNRANMHDAVRSATELLQQEVGQAGRAALRTGVTLSSDVAVGAATVNDPSSSIFVGENLVIDAGENQETVTVTAVNAASTPHTFTATYQLAHTLGAPVTVQGGFASGVVPACTQAGVSIPCQVYVGSNTSPTTLTTVTASTGSVLKLYGDINGNNSMVYVEYVCDTAAGTLYRNMMAFDATGKPSPNPSQVLLSNLLQNPGGTPCFTYEQKTVYNTTYVVNVAISLTTRTQSRDRVTRQFQTETKALLNVAPRNVFDAWLLVSMGSSNRVQPMPPSVAALLH
jgi:prepilin-type N-terminal cleavage/methylation domain-containing protein